jgi:hypothetical protein
MSMEVLGLRREQMLREAECGRLKKEYTMPKQRSKTKRDEDL